jgi:ABC-type lipoprotein export system ATPase subunit
VNQPAVTARDLTVGYGTAAPVLDHLDLDVLPGQAMALTGPSGCGKSTLLFALSGMIGAWSGSVHLLGAELTTMTERGRAEARARSVGFVFQESLLDPARRVIDSVTEVALYRGVRRSSLVARAHDLLEALGVGHLAGRRPGQVSGGQAQRIALARALVGEPAVIFADEPTGNLDPASADVVLATLLDYVTTRSATLVVATHSREIAAACTTVVEL